MLNLSHRQLNRIGTGTFSARVQAAVAQQFPDQAAALPEEAFAKEVEDLVQRAGAYGLTDERSAAVFVVTAWLLGEDFDAQYPELKALLQVKALLPMQKSAAMEAFATTLLDALESASKGGP